MSQKLIRHRKSGKLARHPAVVERLLQATYPGRPRTVLFGGQPLGDEIGAEATWYGYWPPQGQNHLRKFCPSGHVRSFSPRGLKDLTEDCGFKVVGWWNQDVHALYRITPWAGRGIGVVLTKTS